MYRKIIFSMLCIMLAGGSLYAQDGNTVKLFKQMAYISWDPTIPLNNPFVGKTSFRGGSFGYRKMLTSGRVSVGADISWNVFDEYTPRKTYQTGSNGAVTTDFYQYMYTLPMTINAQYYFVHKNVYNPYIGLGIGTTYAKQELYYNTYVSNDYQWGFLVRPELGLLITPDHFSGWGLLIGARYNYSTNKQTDFKIDNLKSLEFQLGLAWNW